MPRKMLTLFGILLILFPMPNALAQLEEVGRDIQQEARPAQALRLGGVPNQEPQEKDKKADEEKAEEPIVDTADSKPIVQVDPRLIRIRMWDGSVITGKVGFDAIHVETEFGKLRVPIERVVRMVPGLESNAEQKQKLDALVAQLGSRSFDEREAAHRALLGMGSSIKDVLGKYDAAGSAERKKHLQKLGEEIAAMMDEDPGMTTEQGVGLLDRVVTPDFDIVGRVVETSFKIDTKYGKLEIQLADIKAGERNFTSSSNPVMKSVDVSSTAFVQRTLVSTRIRVSRGDKITINASGIVSWTNWGNVQSTPDGLTNHGNYLGIPSGRLLAVIGEGSRPVAIGKKKSFVAPRSGILKLGISMQDRYATPERGYRWEGNYTAKIRVNPAK